MSVVSRADFSLCRCSNDVDLSQAVDILDSNCYRPYFITTSYNVLQSNCFDIHISFHLSKLLVLDEILCHTVCQKVFFVYLLELSN